MQIAEASYHQERLWFIERFEKKSVYDHSPVYHNALLIVNIEGQPDAVLLEQCFRSVIQRHEVLRTVIVTRDEQPFQQVNDSIPFILEMRDAQGWDRKTSGVEELFGPAIEAAGEPMPIDGPSLVRGILYRIDGSAHALAIIVHHAVADRYTLNKIAEELFAQYEAFGAGGSVVPGEELTYRDFGSWQKRIPADALESMAFFWKKRLNGGKLAVLQQPTDLPRALVHVYKAGHTCFELDRELVRQLESYAAQHDLEPAHIFLAAFQVLLSRYSGQEEIVVGTNANRREELGLSGVMGPVSNLIVLRSHLSPESSMEALVKEITTMIEETGPFQDMPFDKLVLVLAPQKDMSRTALFDVLFDYTTALPIKSPAGLRLAIQETNHGWGKYDLNLQLIRKSSGAIQGILVFNRCLYEEKSARRLALHYQVLLRSIIKQAGGAIARMDYLSQAEIDQLQFDWNDTAANYPKGQLIHGVFEEKALACPDDTAVVHDGISLTYAGLNKQSNSLARRLREQYGIRPNDRVAVLMNPSQDMIPALIGVLKAGGAYVPIDPTYPRERVDYILEDSGCKILLTTKEIIAALALQYDGPLLELPLSVEAGEDVNPLPHANVPGDTAYVIYTSGTTGKPKGCLVSHENVIRLLINDKLPFRFSSKDVWVMAHSFCFDFSVWEMYGALLYGGRLILPFREEVRDTSRFLALIRQYGVTVLNQTPGAFYQLIAEELEQAGNGLAGHLRYVCLGGDKLEPEYLRPWVERYSVETIALVNMYGITETTVHVTYHFLREADLEAGAGKSPIGRPLPETTVYIRDERLQWVAAGIPGEVFVGGTGVSKGYLNRPALSAEKFIADPYRPSERLYRTGDLAKWLEDGSLDYIGRKDDQLKIRGYRIELPEIENNLLGYPGIEKAVVVPVGDVRKGAVLAAYFTGAGEISVEGVKAYLMSRLPDYMIPSFFIALEAFPLTGNGKIDKKNLPDPQDRRQPATVTRKEATTATEKKLAVIWKEVLDHPGPGINENFFDLGGHSLKAVRLIAAVRKETGVHLELQQIFLQPTIEQLAVLIDRTAPADGREAPANVQPIEPVPVRGYYDLSHSQWRLWVLSQFAESSLAYHVPGGVLLEGSLDKRAFDRALQSLADRHESLRTCFLSVGGVPKQKVIPAGDFRLEADYRDLRNIAGQEEWITRSSREQQDTLFDLGTGPLIRVALLQLEDEKFLVLCTLHHIISDGLTLRLLIREMLQLYDAFHKGLPDPLVPLRIQYKDYVYWQRRLLADERLVREHREYWFEKLGGELPALDLPTDLPRSRARRYRGGRQMLRLDASVAGQFRDITRQHQATLYMSVVALIKVLLYRYTGQRDILTGMAASGREQPDLAEQAGFFVNTIVLRDTVDPSAGFGRFLDAVRSNILSAFRYQDYPFDKLLEDLSITSEPGRHPVFDVMINEPPDTHSEWENTGGGLKVSPVDMESGTAKFDMMFTLHQQDGGLELGIEYDLDLYGDETIVRMLGHLNNLAQAIGEDPDLAIGKLAIMGEAEYSLVRQFSAADGPDKGRYVLDPGGYMTPIGVIGEVFGHDMERTGCKGRWMPDGSLRITDLGPDLLWIGEAYVNRHELEQVLCSQPWITDCRILHHGSPDTGWAVAWIVTPEKMRPDVMLRQLGSVLSSEALRSIQFINVPALPHNDKKALRELSLSDPRSVKALEEQMAGVEDMLAYRMSGELQSIPVSNILLKNILPEQAPAASTEHVTQGGHIPAESGRKAYSDGGELVPDAEDPVTLTMALLRTAKRFPDRGITFINERREPSFQSYPTLVAEAKHVLGGLRAMGLGAGDKVLLQIKNSRDHFSAFWGCVLGGIIPVTVAVPPSYRRSNSVLGKLYNTGRLLKDPAIICSEEIRPELLSWAAEQGVAGRILSLAELMTHVPAMDIHPARPEEVVFMQLTSGSTGVPKCIQETHEAIIWHIQGSARYCGYSADDITLNWLPFDHVVPILTFHLKDVYLGIRQTEVRTEVILGEPLKWLDYIEQYGVTHSWSPNFGFKMVADELGRCKGNWDLSGVKFLMNAGEQVTLPVISRFLELTAPYGIGMGVMQPAFGMAEVCTCMTYVNDFDFSQLHHAKKSSLKGRLEMNAEPSVDTVSFMELGAPMPGVEIRITDDNNRVVEEGVIGRFQIRSKSVTPGYLYNQAANDEAFAGDGWFNSGDLGFIVNGRLTLTGREKETIVIRGGNYYCYEFEDEVSLIAGVLPTYVGSCAVRDPHTGTEGLAIFFSPVNEAMDGNREVVRQIRKVITARFGVEPAYIVPIGKDGFPKTTSGKIQRKQLKEQLESGMYDEIIAGTGMTTAESVPDHFFEKEWHEKGLPAAQGGYTGKLLLFTDRAPDIQELLPAEISAVSVSPGPVYEKRDVHHYVIDPSVPEHYDQVFRELKMDGLLPDQIIHSWGYDKGGDVEGQDRIGHQLQYGFYSLRDLTRALAGYAVGPIHLWLVTSDLQQVLPGDRVDYSQSPVTGLLHSLGIELPWLRCHHLDIPEQDMKGAFSCLLREIGGHRADREIAWRNGIRYVGGLRKIDLQKNRSLSIPLRRGGLYLLTGGLGGAGFEIARQLLQEYDARLLLTGRTVLPEGGEECFSPVVKARLQNYTALRNIGYAEYRSIDVCDTENMEAFVSGMESSFGRRLDGILHLAGIMDESKAHWQEVEQHLAIHEKREWSEKMFHAKIYGSLALSKLMGTRPGSLFVAFSSVNAYFGGYSYSAYAAANSFLDHFTRYLREEGKVRAHCINWSMWENTGMNKDNHMRAVINAKGFRSIGTAQCVNSFLVALGLDRPQVFIGLDHSNWHIQQHLDITGYMKWVLSFYYVAAVRGNGSPAPGVIAADTMTFEAIAARARAEGMNIRVRALDTEYLDEQGRIDEEVLHALSIATDAGQAYKAPGTALEKELAVIWQEVLERVHIGIHDNFFELGGNSVRLVQLFNRLEDVYPGVFGIGDLFDAPDIHRLGVFLEEHAGRREETVLDNRKVKKLSF